MSTPARSPFHVVVPIVALLAAPSQYDVRPGDTLSEIAADHGVTTQALADANEIADPHSIRAGDTLTIPSDGAGTGRMHVVRPGETLSRIAALFGVKVALLAAANGITQPDVVWAGRRLSIPSEGDSVSVDPGGPTGVRRHVVAPGETLSHVAARYGVSVEALAEANGISNPNHVRAGQTLTVEEVWHCPVTGPVHFVDDFGIPKGNGRFHEGVDVFAPRGTPVVAPVGGNVRQQDGSIGGLQAWLWGDDGHLYIATHLDTLGAHGRVEAGTQIGTVGTSGNATGTSPHLHFEMHLGSLAPASPYPLLAQTCDRSAPPPGSSG